MDLKMHLIGQEIRQTFIEIIIQIMLMQLSEQEVYKRQRWGLFAGILYRQFILEQNYLII